ncbi:MAG: FKBP-type peptidyl-prolyl cis-trans isomerase [Thermoplasmata archaeon]
MEDGDLIYIDFDIWVLPEDKGSEELLFRTTDEEKAHKHEIYDEETSYGPRVVEIGRGMLMEGFEEDVKKAELEEERSVEIPPEKAMGNRDVGKIELFSKRELERKGVDVVVGEEVQLEDRSGTIIQTTAGRVRVDFNHPLAGKTLRFDYTIPSKAEELEEKVDAILEKNYGDAEFKIKIEEDELEVILPDECKYGQGWFIVKYQVVGDIRKHTEIKSIRFVEEYEGKIEETVEEVEDMDIEEESEALAEELEEENLDDESEEE